MTNTLDEKEEPGGEKSRENWAAWDHVEPGGEEAEAWEWGMRGLESKGWVVQFSPTSSP